MEMKTILIEAGVRVVEEGDHHCRPDWVQMECPFCGRGSGKLHLGYSLLNRYFNCYKCGFHPSVSTLAELTGWEMRDAYKAFQGVEKPHVASAKKIAGGKLVLPYGLGPLRSPHRKYLRARQFDLNYLADVWQVQGISHAPVLAWRVFIPIVHSGEVVSWTTRSVRDTGPRYMAAKPEQEKIHARELLYGEDYCVNSIVVHEGPTDVWATGPGAVALMGMSWTKAQLLRMAKYSLRVVCFDSTPDAQRRARKLCDQLEVFPGTTTRVELESGKDSASSSQREVQTLRSMASLPPMFHSQSA